MFSIVTGASSGIGVHYSTLLARDYRSDVLLVSNQREALSALAKDIEDSYGVRAIAYYADLSLPSAAEEIYSLCQRNGWLVDVLINNAGIFFFNSYTHTSMSRIETMLNLHVVTVAKLCRLFGESMRLRQLTDAEKNECIDGHRRRKGYILNMSSMSAWMAMPGIQTYNATKAFLYNFSKSLWYEYRLDDVSVTVMTPGAVDTGLYGLASHLRRLAVALHVSIPPDKLAKRALRKMFAGKKSDMPGLLNHLFVPFIKHLPDWLVLFIIRRLDKYFR